MGNSKFFKPTLLYKEFMILDMIEKNPNITQRDMSDDLGISVSMVNDHLDIFEQNGFIKRVKHSSKVVDYNITKKGIERKKFLNIGYLSSAQSLYNSAKENIEKFLVQIEDKGFRNVLLYGAGEVCEILLSTLISNPTININCLAIIDDDPNKLDQEILGVSIIERSQVKDFDHDGILISSFINRDLIHNKLSEINYEKNRILNFFD